MNKDEIITKNCPHVSYTDYGVYACSLYKPRDKNSFVKFGTCGANKTCPYKIAELKTRECEKYSKALNEIETELSLGFTTTSFYKILNIINKAKGDEK